MLLDVNIDSDKTSLTVTVDGQRKSFASPEELWDALWAACARAARAQPQPQPTSSALRVVRAPVRVEHSRMMSSEDDVVDGEVLDEDDTGASTSQQSQAAAATKRSLRDRVRQDGAEKVVDEVFDDAMVHLGVETFRMTVGAIGAVQKIFSKKKNRKKKRAVPAQATGKNTAPRGQETRIKRWAP